MNLDRLGNITSELTSSLVKSIVLPSGLLDWLTRPLSERVKRLTGVPDSKAQEHVDAQRDMNRSPVAVPTGPLALFGGFPVPDEAIVALIHLLGGRTARLAVLPVAADDQEQSGQEAQRLFTRFGMKQVTVLTGVTRELLDQEAWNDALAGFEAVIVCGEDPSLGLQRLENTLAARTLRALNAAGKLVAGLSGGAALLGEQFIALDEGQEQVKQGLGLATGLLVDTDFTQQSRFGRLVKGLNAQSASGLLGAGLDAGAAVIIRDGEAKVLGDTSVTFLDAREVLPVYDQANCTPGAMCGLKVHVLMAEFGMNLRTRKPTSPVRESPQAVNDR